MVKKVCKGHGPKLVTLLAIDELYTGGKREKPIESEWVSAFLRTLRRIPSLADSYARRCLGADWFMDGVSIALFGNIAKRPHRHIEDDLDAIPHPKLYRDDVDMPPLWETPPPNHPKPGGSLRPRGTSLDSGGAPGTPVVSETFVFLDCLCSIKKIESAYVPAACHGE